MLGKDHIWWLSVNSLETWSSTVRLIGSSSSHAQSSTSSSFSICWLPSSLRLLPRFKARKSRLALRRRLSRSLRCKTPSWATKDASLTPTKSSSSPRSSALTRSSSRIRLKVRRLRSSTTNSQHSRQNSWTSLTISSSSSLKPSWASSMRVRRFRIPSTPTC